MIGNWADLIWGKLSRWGVYLVKMLPNLLLAVLVMVLFVLLARLIKKITARVIHRLSKSESVSGLTSAIVSAIIIGIGFTIALKVLNLDQAVTSLLAGVGIAGLALGFAFQDLTSNFISGAFIVFKRPFDVGHTVETNGFVGTIEDIQLRATLLRTLAGLHVIIPNKDIFQKAIINYSLTSARRVELEFFIPNAVGLRSASQGLRDAIEEVEGKSAQPSTEVFFSAIEEGKTKVYISFWTSSTEPDRFLKVKHQAILAATDKIKELTTVTT